MTTTSLGIPLSASMVVGINSGYGENDPNNKLEDITEFCLLLDDIIEKSGAEYIPFNVVKSRTVYKREWGCPPGGESTYTLTATANPEFTKNPTEWVYACTDIASMIRERLDQSSLLLTITGPGNLSRTIRFTK